MENNKIIRQKTLFRDKTIIANILEEETQTPYKKKIVEFIYIEDSVLKKAYLYLYGENEEVYSYINNNNDINKWSKWVLKLENNSEIKLSKNIFEEAFNKSIKILSKKPSLHLRTPFVSLKAFIVEDSNYPRIEIEEIFENENLKEKFACISANLIDKKISLHSYKKTSLTHFEKPSLKNIKNFHYIIKHYYDIDIENAYALDDSNIIKLFKDWEIEMEIGKNYIILKQYEKTYLYNTTTSFSKDVIILSQIFEL